MLGLKLPTDPRWVEIASMNLEDILTDHAYCEQKAASTMISIIIQFPEHMNMVNELAPIVTEEWGHFRMVMNELNKRGMKLGYPRKDEYVSGLIKFSKTPGGGSRIDRLVEQLLMCALIEARSCERFRILSEGLEDEYLKDFYYKFMVSEAGHYRMFLDLAKSFKEEKVVLARWQEWLDFEKELLLEIGLRGDRLH